MDLPLTIAEVQQVAEFRIALRRFQQRSDAAARSAGLTPQRYLLLVAIKGAPDGTAQATITDLSARLEMAQTTISDLVSRAEGVGLIARHVSPADARVSCLSLTPQGEQRLAHCLRSLDGGRADLEHTLQVASRRIRSMAHGG